MATILQQKQFVSLELMPLYSLKAVSWEISVKLIAESIQGSEAMAEVKGDWEDLCQRGHTLGERQLSRAGKGTW